MEWTTYHADHYMKDGRVDRKAECDAFWKKGAIRDRYMVVKSTMVGNTYYAAVKKLQKKLQEGEDTYEPIPEKEQPTFGVVFLTSVNSRNYDNFSYKKIEETSGTMETDCPASIIRLLSNTNQKYALNWRNACLENARKRKASRKSRKELAELPVGSVIEFQSEWSFSSASHVGETIRLTKQYLPEKDLFIWTDGKNRWREKMISDQFRIVER